MPTSPTTKHGLPKLSGGDDINDYPGVHNEAMDDLDAIIAVADQTMPRPAAGKFGRWHRSTDGTLAFDTGSAWVTIIRSGAGQVADSDVAAGAAIAESKLALASDAAAGTASRRSLGTGASQAAAGNHLHDDRYYTESEVNTLLNGKQDAGTAATDAELAAHTSRTDNPHGVTKGQVGLGNADNTSDANKPVSTAQQTALNGKSNTGHTHDDRYYTEAEVNAIVSSLFGVKGRVRRDGTILQGANFTVTSHLIGWRVDFTTAFATPPRVDIVPYDPNFDDVHLAAPKVYEVTTTYFNVLFAAADSPHAAQHPGFIFDAAAF